MGDAPAAAGEGPSRAFKQLTLDIGLSEAPSLDTFLGAGNEEAVQAVRGLEPGMPGLYLWGPSGSGKTHLLQALQTRSLALGLRVEAFGERSTVPWELDPQASFLLLDDAQQWSPEQQHAAFAAFVQAGMQGCTVVAAGRFPPVDLPLREDIRTRLGWGLVVGLQALGESALRQALQLDARRRGLKLGDEVLDYALRRLDRDLKSLASLMQRLDHYALSHQRPLTVPLLRQMLDEERSR